MSYLVTKLNGLIRIKVDSFKRACATYDIDFIEADYTIKANDPYFSGLIDTDGSIVFNYTSNRIECSLELKTFLIFLHLQATAADIEIIYDVCWMLSPMQIQRMCTNYYVADYEVRFIIATVALHIE